MSETQKERERVKRSKERVIDPVPAAFAEKLEAELVRLRKQVEEVRAIEATWKPVEVAKLLGIGPNTPIRAGIDKAVREMSRECEDLRRTVKMLVRYIP